MRKDVKNYLLIGISIFAVILLILGSLTNVVGYQSVKLSTLSESPLFSMRTQRATNQEQNSITSRYLGKEKEILLLFPSRDYSINLLRKFITITSNMNQKTFEKIIELCLNKIRQNTINDETNLDKIKQMFYELKTKPDIIKNYFFNENNCNITSSSYSTVCHWIPGCGILRISEYLWAIFVFLCFIIYLLSNGPTFTCLSVCVCVN